MEKDLTVRSSLELEIVFSLQLGKVIDFTIADSADVATNERLISSIRQIVDTKTLET